MEIFNTERSYVLLCGESSLWIDKKSGDVSVNPAWELANGHDPECLGVFFGLVGRIRCQNLIDDHIILVKESVLVGELPSGHAVHKIKSVAIMSLSSEVQCEQLGLKRCPKHHRSIENVEQNLTNNALTKTWSSLKTATTNIKSTAQQSSHLQNLGKTPQDLKEKRGTREKERYQRRIIEELYRIFTDTSSFYFCPAGGDITNSVYRQFKIGSENPENGPMWSLADDRFFWNKHMLQDIINLKSPLSEIWIMPIIQGYVEIRECKLDFGENQKHEVFTVSLISRRSRYRVGTRYKRRGVDEDGHCANYVETEQIVKYKKHVASFVLLRGSIPLYWSQQGYKYRPPPQLHKSYEENQCIMEKHLRDDIAGYGPLVIINLVERTGKEAIVGNAYSDHICTFSSPDITYVTFDFHHYCRGMRFENVSLLIDELQDEIAKIGYTWIDNEGLISKQNGTFRVNCIDCLDRTNIVQTAVAREVLIMQMIKLGLMSPEAPNQLLIITQQMWANNGDVISKQYAGTNALKGDITRTGERKISGMMKDGMNSANRYYLSRFKDTTRQATLDIMLGNEVEDSVVQQKDASSEEDDDNSSIAEDEKSIDHVKQVIEDTKNMIIEDVSDVIAAWGLVNAECGELGNDMDGIIVLTHSSCFLVDYDPDLDKITKYEEVPLNCLKLLEIIVWNTATSNTSVSQTGQKGSPKKRQESPILTLHYVPSPNYPTNILQRSFRSTNLRFFNNLAVVIRNNEEKIESLRAICETIQATCQVCGVESVEFNVRYVQRKSSIFNSDALISLRPSDAQISSLKNVGSKAIMNVSQQFSKFNFKYGRSKQKPKKEEEAWSDAQEAFLPTAGIVLSNTEISSAGPPDIVIDSIEPTQIITDTHMNKCHSTECIDKLLQQADSPALPKTSSYKDLSLNLPPLHGENKLQSIKSGFATATNALVSPTSPLTRFAKGMQTLGSNLDPRKLKGSKANQGQNIVPTLITENNKLKEQWSSSNCKSKLIAL